MISDMNSPQFLHPENQDITIPLFGENLDS